MEEPLCSAPAAYDLSYRSTSHSRKFISSAYRTFASDWTCQPWISSWATWDFGTWDSGSFSLSSGTGCRVSLWILGTFTFAFLSIIITSDFIFWFKCFYNKNSIWKILNVNCGKSFVFKNLNNKKTENKQGVLNILISESTRKLFIVKEKNVLFHNKIRLVQSSIK